jgi:hypothetical protein
VNPPAPIVAGTAVILTGDWLHTTLQTVLIAARTRRHNGLPITSADTALAQALTAAVAANGHEDVPEPAVLQHYPQTQPTVTVEDGARQLNLSRRQTRRLAPKLGGKLIGGQWRLDQAAIDEHLRGKDNIWTATAQSATSPP